jgi:SAM-dependent methyltransferase
VLDTGCGDREFIVFLRRLGFQVAGVEPSEAAAAKARERCPETDIRVGSLEDRLPFPNMAFDAI